LRLISWPHDGPTSLRLTSSTDEPVSSVRALVTLSEFSGLIGSDSMRRARPLSLSSSWIVAFASPYWDTASRASATVASPAGTSHTTPPSKSMPRFRPRTPSDRRLIATATSEIVNHNRLRPTKSKLVSPW
jgi:hypothetical protein